jgi:hypothetical protein
LKRNEAKLRYINDLCEACSAITKKYSPEVNGHLLVREMSLRAIHAWSEQWAPHNQRTPPNGGWDWNGIRSSPRFAREVNVFKIAVWGKDDLLAGLSIGLSNRTAVCLEAVEAYPLLRPPMKGIILPVVLDCAAAYAQLTGRREIWLLEPAGDELINLYTSVYEFELVTPRRGKRYCRKEV